MLTESTTPFRRKIVGAAALASLVLGAGAVIGHADGGEQTFHACAKNNVNAKVSDIRLDVAPSCGPNETPVSWTSGGGAGSGAEAATTDVAFARDTFGRSACAGTTWLFISDNCGSSVAIARTFGTEVDTANYPAGTTAKLEAASYNYSAAPVTACVRLYDLDTATVVTGSETCTTIRALASGEPGFGEFESASFVLNSGSHTYAWQSSTPATAAPGYAAIIGPALRLNW